MRRFSVRGSAAELKIMFPMITTVEEIRSAQRVLKEARAELKNRGVAFADAVEIGIMVEVPSAAICAPALAHEVDFFSIGTNDLIQYTLAVDRTNERVDYLYDPLHPAVLHLIKHVIVAAHQAGKWVGMCGEMAGDLDALPLLLGMGLDEFSVTAATIPNVKATIRSLDLRAAQDLARTPWNCRQPPRFAYWRVNTDPNSTHDHTGPRLYAAVGGGQRRACGLAFCKGRV